MAHFSKAQEAYHKVINLQPDAWNVRLELAQLQLLSGDMKSSQETWEQLRDQVPNSPAVVVFHGDLMMLKRKFHEAEEDYCRAISIDPNYKLARIKLAMCYLAQYHPQDYPEVESMVVLHRAGFRMKELPVTIYPRTGGVSSIGTWKAIYYVFRVMLAAMIAAVRSLPNEHTQQVDRHPFRVARHPVEPEQIPEEETHVA